MGYGYGYCCCDRCWTVWAINRATGELQWRVMPQFVPAFGVPHIEADGAGGFLISGSHARCRTGANPSGSRYDVARYDGAGERIWRKELSPGSVSSVAGALIDPDFSDYVVAWDPYTAPEKFILNLSDGSQVSNSGSSPRSADMADAHYTKTRIRPTSGSWNYDFYGSDEAGDPLSNSTFDQAYLGESRETDFVPVLSWTSVFQQFRKLRIWDVIGGSFIASSGAGTSPASDGSDWAICADHARTNAEGICAVPVMSRTPPSGLANDDATTLFFDVTTGIEVSRYSRFSSPFFTPGASGSLTSSGLYTLCDSVYLDVLEWYAGITEAAGFPSIQYWGGDGTSRWTGHFETPAGTAWAGVRHAWFLNNETVLLLTSQAGRWIQDS